MEREIWFFGFRFSTLKFAGMCLAWTFFVAFIWPMIIGSYWFVSVFVCFGALLLTAIVTSKLLLGLILLFIVSKKAVLVYQYIMLFLSTLLTTWIFSWFVSMSTFTFIDHLLVNTFTVYMYYTGLKEADKD